MKLLVLQHQTCEGPGYLSPLIAAQNVDMDVLLMSRGAAFPPLDTYDAMIVMGGAMNVWEIDRYPWLKHEIEFVRRWVEVDKPFLGVCLGHQILACACGGTVGPMASPQIGLATIHLTPAGERDTLFAGIGHPLRVLQWHGAEVIDAPTGASVLARSGSGGIQAIRMGQCAAGVQFHPEVTMTTVDEWCELPENRAELMGVGGPNAHTALRSDVGQMLPDLNRTASFMLKNFLSTIVETSSVKPFTMNPRDPEVADALSTSTVAVPGSYAFVSGRDD